MGDFSRTITINQLTGGYLRRHYLFGIELRDSYNNKMTDDIIESHIDKQIVNLERKAGVRLTPTRIYTPPNPNDPTSEGKTIGEDYDELGTPYDWNWKDAINHGMLTLRHGNIVKVDRIRTVFQGQIIWEVPQAWVRLKPKVGIIQLMPTLLIPQGVAINQTGFAFTGAMFTRMAGNTYPNYWILDYSYGLSDLPLDVADFICLKASMIALEEFATAYNPGIASRSISLGSIFSESQTYTASAMFSLMSAQIETFRKRLNEINENDLIKTLKSGLKVFSI